MLALLAADAIEMLSVLAFFMLNRLRVRLRPPRLPPAPSSVTAANDAASGEGASAPATVEGEAAGPETLRMSGLAFDPGSAAPSLPFPLSLPMKPFLAFSGPAAAAAAGATAAAAAEAAGLPTVVVGGREGSFCACDCESGLGLAGCLRPSAPPAVVDGAGEALTLRSPATLGAADDRWEADSARWLLRADGGWCWWAATALRDEMDPPEADDDESECPRAWSAADTAAAAVERGFPWPAEDVGGAAVAAWREADEREFTLESDRAPSAARAYGRAGRPRSDPLAAGVGESRADAVADDDGPVVGTGLRSGLR